MSFLFAIVSDAAIYLGPGLALWLSFRVLRYPDLALEREFVLGGVVYAVAVRNGLGLTTVVGVIIVGGLALGFLCSVLRNQFRIHAVILSLAASYAYYSLALVILGAPNDYVGDVAPPPTASHALLLTLGTFTGVAVLLHSLQATRSGLRIVAAGSNWDLARGHDLAPTLWQGVGLGLSFILSMSAGALSTWRAGYVDVTSGDGLLLIGIFVVVVTSLLMRRIKIGPNAALVAGLTAVYLLFLQGSLALGMPPQWLRGVNALALIVLVLLLPKVSGRVLSF